MKKMIAFALAAGLVMVAGAEMKKFGKIKAKDEVVVGIEAGNGLVVDSTDKSKISVDSASYTGLAPVVKTATTSSNDGYVKYVSGEQTLHIYGHARSGMVVTNKIAAGHTVLVHMPKDMKFGTQFWCLNLVDDVATEREITFQYDELTQLNPTGATIFQGYPASVKAGMNVSSKTNNWLMVFDSVGISNAFYTVSTAVGATY